jgi:predicted RNA binding protein YcfA (HicA-like mRNA interferase family)
MGTGTKACQSPFLSPHQCAPLVWPPSLPFPKTTFGINGTSFADCWVVGIHTRVNRAMQIAIRYVAWGGIIKMRRKRTMARVLGGQADSSIRFEELCSLLVRLGFHSRTRGSHRIFWRDGIEELINVQTAGENAKPYQVKQVRMVILKYNLDEELQ